MIQSFRQGGLGVTAGALRREGPDQTRVWLPSSRAAIAGVKPQPASEGGTYYVLAVLGEGLFHKHRAQGEAQVVLCVTHAQLPARKAGLETEGGVTGPRPRSRPLIVWEAAPAGIPASFQNSRETFSDPVGVL